VALKTSFAGMRRALESKGLEVKGLRVDPGKLDTILDKGIVEDLLKKAKVHAQSLKKNSGFND